MRLLIAPYELLEAHQSVFHASACCCRRAAEAPSQWRIRTLATALWEHTIRNEIDFERNVDDVHFNPVKHKLVRREREWPYSSFHVYVRRSLLPADWAGEVEEPNDGFRRAEGLTRISFRPIQV